MAGNNKSVMEITGALKKQSLKKTIRSALPIIGLIAVCIIFNILTKGSMWNSRKYWSKSNSIIYRNRRYTKKSRKFWTRMPSICNNTKSN